MKIIIAKSDESALKQILTKKESWMIQRAITARLDALTHPDFKAYPGVQDDIREYKALHLKLYQSHHEPNGTPGS